MTDTTTTDVTTTVASHLALLNETDADRRAALLPAVWTEDGRWVDPPIEGIGYEGIGEMVAAIQAHFPEHEFRRVSGVDAHHDQLRFAWELVAPDGAIALTGLDVATVADDGRLLRVTGFLGDLPPIED